MVPETESELFQLKLTGFAPVAVAPNPVPMVVQPAASTASSGSATITFVCLMSLLLFVSGEHNCHRYKE
jgi:hypothetical protein